MNQKILIHNKYQHSIYTLFFKIQWYFLYPAYYLNAQKMKGCEKKDVKHYASFLSLIKFTIFISRMNAVRK